MYKFMIWSIVKAFSDIRGFSIQVLISASISRQSSWILLFGKNFAILLLNGISALVCISLVLSRSSAPSKYSRYIAKSDFTGFFHLLHNTMIIDYSSFNCFLIRAFKLLSHYLLSFLLLFFSFFILVLFHFPWNPLMSFKCFR